MKFYFAVGDTKWRPCTTDIRDHSAHFLRKNTFLSISKVGHTSSVWELLEQSLFQLPFRGVRFLATKKILESSGGPLSYHNCAFILYRPSTVETFILMKSYQRQQVKFAKRNHEQQPVM